jgi:hypothetical protein
MRFSVFAIWCCVLLSACDSQRPPPQAPKPDVPVERVAAAAPGPITKELPMQWQKDDIVDAMPPRSDNGPTYILAWKIVEDARPVRVEFCLGLKQLNKITEKQEKWVIASLVRNPAQGKDWNFGTIYITPDPDFKNPPFIMHVQEYKERPTTVDVNKFMDKFDWKFKAESDWKLIDGGVCEAWEKSLGEKPTRSFPR